MSRNEKLDEALRTMDFYKLAKITYERSNPMKINVNQVESEEQLEFHGNRFFTQEQINEIMRA